MPNNHRSYGCTSKERLYEELSVGSLQLCRWFRKLCYFYKFYKNKSQYLVEVVPFLLTPLKMLKRYPFPKQNKIFKKNHFFHSAVIEWNNLDHNIWTVGSFNVFKNKILKFIWSTPNSVLILKIIDESNSLQGCCCEPFAWKQVQTKFSGYIKSNLQLQIWC